METRITRSAKAVLLGSLMLACWSNTRAAAQHVSDHTGQPHGRQMNHPCDPQANGAVNDGKTDNTEAIQSAIDACASLGGGIVPIAGGGTYITGPIHLKSHILLWITAPTILKNTNDHSRYQPGFVGYPFEFQNDPAVTGVGPSLPGKPEAMISAHDAEDVGIIGNGTIDGSGNSKPAFATPDNPNGESYLQQAWEYTEAQIPFPGFPDIPISNGLPRPFLVEFYNCRNVLVKDVLLTNSPFWNTVLRFDTNVAVTGLRVYNNPADPNNFNAKNTDGIDAIASTNVRLSNLDIDTGDDDVALDSGLPGFDPAQPGVPTFAYFKPPFNMPRVPLTNVTIVDSTFKRGHGLSVGSMTVNGIQHIRVNNIQFLGTDNGFRIKTGRDRGNQINDMVVRNLRMTDVPVPLSLSEYYPTIPGPTQADIPQPHIPATQPYVHDIVISNLTATNPRTVRDTEMSGGLIIGIPESPIYNVKLDNVHISAAAPTFMRLRNLDHLVCNNVVITPLNAGPPNDGHTFDNEGGLTNITGCDLDSTQVPQS
jgi:polygalacturonase